MMMKNYMLSLPSAELDNFMFGNIEKIKTGIASLAAKQPLNAEFKAQLTQQLDQIDASLARLNSLEKAA